MFVEVNPIIFESFYILHPTCEQILWGLILSLTVSKMAPQEGLIRGGDQTQVPPGSLWLRVGADGRNGETWEEDTRGWTDCSGCSGGGRRGLCESSADKICSRRLKVGVTEGGREIPPRNTHSVGVGSHELT